MRTEDTFCGSRSRLGKNVTCGCNPRRTFFCITVELNVNAKIFISFASMRSSSYFSISNKKLHVFLTVWKRLLMEPIVRFPHICECSSVVGLEIWIFSSSLIKNEEKTITTRPSNDLDRWHSAHVDMIYNTMTENSTIVYVY